MSTKYPDDLFLTKIPSMSGLVATYAADPDEKAGKHYVLYRLLDEAEARREAEQAKYERILAKLGALASKSAARERDLRAELKRLKQDNERMLETIVQLEAQLESRGDQ